MRINKEIIIYVSFSYESDIDAYKKEDFTSTISLLIDSIQRDIGAQDFSFNISVAAQNFAKYSVEQINNKLQDCDIAIIDISQLSPKSIYEIGFLSGIKTPNLIIAPDNIKLDNLNIIKDGIFIFKSIRDLINKVEFKNQLTRLIEEQVQNYSLIKRYFYDVWFPKSTNNILLVVSTEPVKPKDANLESPNYSLLDNVGDKDAVIEIVKLLSKHYPTANITISPSDTFDSQNLRNNLVVIGGPGGGKPGEGNVVCRKFMRKIPTKIHYDEDCEKMLYGNEVFQASFDQGLMEEDYGYFAAIQNPFHSEYRTILVHGIHTLGVVGAAKAFSDIADAEHNYQVLYSDIRTKPPATLSFESFFSVDVFKGVTICPTISPESLFPIAHKPQSDIQPKHPVAKYNIENPVGYQFLYNYIINLCSSIEQEIPKYSSNSPKLFNEFTAHKKRLEELLLSFEKRLSEGELEVIKDEYEKINGEWSNRDQ